MNGDLMIILGQTLNVIHHYATSGGKRPQKVRVIARHMISSTGAITTKIFTVATA